MLAISYGNTASKGVLVVHRHRPIEMPSRGYADCFYGT
jgi:hypothetical protein